MLTAWIHLALSCHPYLSASPLTAFSGRTKLMDLSFCLSAETGMSMDRSSYEKLSNKFILTLLVVSSITCSSFLNSLRDWMAIQLLFCKALFPGFVQNSMQHPYVIAI